VRAIVLLVLAKVFCSSVGWGWLAIYPEVTIAPTVRVVVSASSWLFITLLALGVLNEPIFAKQADKISVRRG
jgi:predicted acyltransferase